MSRYIIRQLLAPSARLVSVYWSPVMDDGIHFWKEEVIVLALTEADDDPIEQRVEGLSASDLTDEEYSPSHVMGYLGIFLASTPDAELERHAVAAARRVKS